MTSGEIWIVVGMAVAAFFHVFGNRIFATGSRRPERRSKKRVERFVGGYEISRLGHGRDWTRVYEEPRGEPTMAVIVFEGGPQGLLIVPSARRWPLDVPEWAKDRRSEILSRLAAGKGHVGFVEYDNDVSRRRLIFWRRNPSGVFPVV